jgi:hypothetical protein
VLSLQPAQFCNAVLKEDGLNVLQLFIDSREQLCAYRRGEGGAISGGVPENGVEKLAQALLEGIIPLVYSF